MLARPKAPTVDRPAPEVELAVEEAADPEAVLEAALPVVVAEEPAEDPPAVVEDPPEPAEPLSLTAELRQLSQKMHRQPLNITSHRQCIPAVAS